MNRAKLASDFAAATSRNPWKTFVLEAHADHDPTGLLEDAFVNSRVEPTEDAYLHRLVGDVNFVVDHIDHRFWNLHTTQPTGEAMPYLRRVVGSRRDLDWMWLPSDHLRGLWGTTTPTWVATNFSSGRLTPSTGEVDDLSLRVRGSAADQVLDLISTRYQTAVPHSQVGMDLVDEHFGLMTEFVSREGRFMAGGDNFGFHQAIVQRVVARYRRFVEEAERRVLRWEELPEGGARPYGTPITLRFSRPIPDLDYFIEQLFSAREPFRLWGLPRRDHTGLVEVEAVDLHVGQRLRFDVAAEWMRVYLFEGGCGNTVARLATNLQHHFDGALSIADDELDALLRPVAKV